VDAVAYVCMPSTAAVRSTCIIRRQTAGSHGPQRSRRHLSRIHGSTNDQGRNPGRWGWARLGSNQRPPACKAGPAEPTMTTRHDILRPCLALGYDPPRWPIARSSVPVTRAATPSARRRPLLVLNGIQRT